jgi:hypothetical protein
MARRRPKQLALPIPPGWGGRRVGAGRKPSARLPGVWHVRRPKHDRQHPVLITLRADRRLPSLRSERVFSELQTGISRADRSSFRVIHFSVQTDHAHFVVEADDRRALTRGLQGLAARCARAINRALGRHGRVWTDRYHARPLRTPRETRAAIVYVLQNFRKHLGAPAIVDPCSSGRWFKGWEGVPRPNTAPSPVSEPRTWLASVGWRRAGGPIRAEEAPAAVLAPETLPNQVRIAGHAQRRRGSRAEPQAHQMHAMSRAAGAAHVPGFEPAH